MTPDLGSYWTERDTLLAAIRSNYDAHGDALCTFEMVRKPATANAR